MTPIAVFSQLIPTSRPGEYWGGGNYGIRVTISLIYRPRAQATASAARFGRTRATSGSTT